MLFFSSLRPQFWISPKGDEAETLTFWFKCPELGNLDSTGVVQNFWKMRFREDHLYFILS